MKKPRPKPPRDPLSIAIGARIREVRMAQKPPVPLQWIAQECDCTIQQVQKYESGENRVSWPRLCQLAKALDISVIDLIRPVAPKFP